MLKWKKDGKRLVLYPARRMGMATVRRMLAEQEKTKD